MALLPKIWRWGMRILNTDDVGKLGSEKQNNVITILVHLNHAVDATPLVYWSGIPERLFSVASQAFISPVPQFVEG